MARELVGLSARDLLHAAVMQRVGTERIVSADRRFDVIAWLQRLDPATVATWSAQMFQ
jgi:predicted nucleic acid-binding protein